MSRACVGDWHWEQQGEAQGPAVRRGRSGVRAQVGSAGPRRAGGARCTCDMGHMPMGEAESGTTANLTDSFLTDSCEYARSALAGAATAKRRRDRHDWRDRRSSPSSLPC